MAKSSPSKIDHRQALRKLYEQTQSGALDIAQAVKLMRSISGLTQEQFAKHRGISVQALRQIEAGSGNPTVETLNSVAAIFGLKVGFVPAK